MKIEGLQEKEIFDKQFPFRLLVNEDADFTYPPHWHDAIELIYVLHHPLCVFVNSQKYEMNERDILYIPGGDIHEFRGELQDGKRIFINFELSNLNAYANMDRLYTQLRSARLITPADTALYPKIEVELRKVLGARNTDDVVGDLYYTARMIDILVLLSRNTPAQVNLSNLEKGRGKSAGISKIGKSFEYIDKNYREDIRLADIAHAVGFSEYYFSRLFKEITEKNFHQYLNEYRIKKAEALLANPNYTVSEAAYAVGFSSISTFDRLFHQMKGCSPQDFRKLHVGG